VSRGIVILTIGVALAAIWFYLLDVTGSEEQACNDCEFPEGSILYNEQIAVALIILIYIGIWIFQMIDAGLLARRTKSGRMGMSGTTTMFGNSVLNYYCMSCGTKHNQAACPRCGSKMKRVGS
jgi:hypothetical protein